MGPRSALSITLLLPLALACGAEEASIEAALAPDASERLDRDGTQAAAGDAAGSPTADTTILLDGRVAEDAAPEADARTTEDTGQGTDAGTPANDGSAPASDACTNATDATLISQLGEQALTDAISSCLVGCLTNSSRAVCTAECTSDDTGISLGCTTCFAQRADCVAANCLRAPASCLTQPESRSCADCQVANGCVDGFEACSGLQD